MTEFSLRLSVIIVTWNCAEVIRECLTTLRDSNISGDVEIIVVDNASDDDTCGLVAREFPSVKLQRSTSNMGFARANNFAMTVATGNVFLLLNPDMILTDPSAIRQMMGLLESEPSVGIVGCRLNYADGRHQVGDAGYRPSALNMICHGLGIGHLLRQAHGLYVVRPHLHDRLFTDVDWICGACLLVRSSVVAEIGGMDERLFLYAEDVEWGCRIRENNYRVAYLPRVQAVHLQGVSEAQANNANPARKSSISSRWLDSLLGLYVQLNGRRWYALVRLAFVIGFAARASIYASMAVFSSRRRGFYLGRTRALFAYAQAAARRAY